MRVGTMCVGVRDDYNLMRALELITGTVTGTVAVLLFSPTTSSSVNVFEVLSRWSPGIAFLPLVTWFTTLLSLKPPERYACK